jgi:hypothetical protein
MPRTKLATEVPTADTVHVIAETGVYTVDDAIRIFRLRKSTIRREIREGRLRVSKRAGRYFLLGRWLLSWIEGGEIRRNGPARQNGQAE